MCFVLVPRARLHQQAPSIQLSNAANFSSEGHRTSGFSMGPEQLDHSTLSTARMSHLHESPTTRYANVRKSLVGGFGNKLHSQSTESLHRRDSAEENDSHFARKPKTLADLIGADDDAVQVAKGISNRRRGSTLKIGKRSSQEHSSSVG